MFSECDEVSGKRQVLGCGDGRSWALAKTSPLIFCTVSGSLVTKVKYADLLNRVWLLRQDHHFTRLDPNFIRDYALADDPSGYLEG